MYINNLFHLKDWKIEEFLLLIITLQTIFFVLILLEYVGLGIPILKDLIGFFFILFIPGTLLLRLINLDRIESNGQILLYTLGSSLVILMVIGTLMNYLYPILGIDKPLSSVSIIITFYVFTIILCFICYLIDKRRVVEKKSPPNKVDLKNLVSSPLLFLFILPILTILGAYQMNVYHSNVLTMLMIFLVGIIAFMVSLRTFIPSKLYPLIVFIISISLLLHKSLISNYIWGWDINAEYFLANQVILNAFWNESLPFSYNSMLSVVILGPIFSSFINIGEVWIMKIIYPFLFSLVPLGLYYLFCKQTSPKIAFFSVFFFMLMFTFYTEMLSLIRQQVAELMLVLVLMLIVNDKLEVTKRSFLAVMFGLSIVVTHYGLSYVIMLILIISAIFLYFLDKNSNQGLSSKFWPKIYKLTAVNALLQSFPNHFFGNNKNNLSKQGRKPSVSEKINLYRSIKKDRILTSSFLVLFIFFLFTWYIFTSSASIFQATVSIGHGIINNLYTFMDPNTTQGLNMVIEQQFTPLRNLHKYIYLFSQFLIFIGVLALFFRKDGMNFKKEYKALILATFMVLVAGILLPFFSSQMNTSRLYHVALIILAPFCVLGIIKIFDLFKLISRTNFSKDQHFKFIAIFLIVFLLFDTGVVYQLIDYKHPTSIALSSSVDFPIFNQRETTAGEWLTHSYYAYGYQNNYTVYADKNRAPVLGSMLPAEQIPVYFDLITNRSYIFLGTLNVNQGEKILTYKMSGANIISELKYQSSQEILKSRSRIYNNGGSSIYGEVTWFKN